MQSISKLLGTCVANCEQLLRKHVRMQTAKKVFSFEVGVWRNSKLVATHKMFLYTVVVLVKLGEIYVIMWKIITVYFYTSMLCNRNTAKAQSKKDVNWEIHLQIDDTLLPIGGRWFLNFEKAFHRCPSLIQLIQNSVPYTKL